MIDPATTATATASLRAGAIEALLGDFRHQLREHSEHFERLSRDERRLALEADEQWTAQEAALHSRIEDERQRATAAGEARQQYLTERYDRFAERARQAQTRVESQLASRLQAQEDSATQKYQQALWSSSSGYNTARDQALAQRDRELAELDRLAGDFGAVEAAGHRLARRLWISMPERPAEHPEGLVNHEEIGRALVALEADAATAREVMAELRRHTEPWRVLTGRLSLSLIALAAGHAAAVWVLFRLPEEVPFAWRIGLLLALSIWLPAPWLLLKLAQRRARPVLAELRLQLTVAETVLDATRKEVSERFAEAEEAAARRRDETLGKAKKHLDESLARYRRDAAEQASLVTAKASRLGRRIERRRTEELAAASETHRLRLAQIDMVGPDDVAGARQAHEAEVARRRDALAAEFVELKQRWETELTAFYAALVSLQKESEERFPAWSRSWIENWRIPGGFPPALQFGQLRVDARQFAGKLPDPARLPLPGPDSFAVPAVLDFPDRCSLVVESGAQGRDESLALLQSIMLRLLAGSPPGKIGFTIIDPIGLGQSFAGFMHLADYDERFVGRRIWVENRHIEQQLADLNEHIEKVIQKYLRNEFATIADFNASAGEMAERFRFLVICDFPANFTEIATQRLASVINSGPRCGVFVLLHKDRRQPPPRGIDLAALRRQSAWLNFENNAFVWRNSPFAELPLTVDSPPERELFTLLMQRLGESIAEASRVEVPFRDISPAEEERWSRDSSRELRAPIGKAGASKLQDLVLGHGTSQHVLIAGKTGSGKSTLFHVLIGSLALWYGPDEVEFYLIDFKKGVEFKCYAAQALPHLRAVAIESDREFGLSILARVDDELKLRGQLFRDRDVQDLRGYREATGRKLPRTLLIIDEFQELFTADDRVSQDAALLLDRIVRQGRAFGIHVLLGSQTLGGAYSLARTTMGQMAVRIALQCSEADSYLILNDDNAAARLLARPGEAIYNDAAGMIEGNSPFQVTWLPDRERDMCLESLHRLAAERGLLPAEPPIVFEGNAPARYRDNRALMALLTDPATPCPEPATIWLGEPNTIKSATHVAFRPQTGCNLLLVGQNGDTARAVFASCLVSLAAQQRRPGGLRVYLIDGTPAELGQTDYLPALAARLQLPVRYFGYQQAAEAMTAIGGDLAARDDAGGERPLICVLVFALQRFKALRDQDDFSFGRGSDEADTPAADQQFANLLANGPEQGVHSIAWVDSLNNLNRTLSRKSQQEWEYRVLFQMSAADSTTLVDQPTASRLGIHWGLLYGEQQGALEKFRPYALPDDDWLAGLTAAGTTSPT